MQNLIITLLLCVLFVSSSLAVREPPGPNIPGELAAIDFGKMIGGPLTAVVNAPVKTLNLLF